MVSVISVNKYSRYPPPGNNTSRDIEKLVYTRATFFLHLNGPKLYESFLDDLSGRFQRFCCTLAALCGEKGANDKAGSLVGCGIPTWTSSQRQTAASQQRSTNPKIP